MATATAQYSTSTPEPGTILPTPNFSIRLAWFYKPPVNVSLVKLASEFNFFILTKGDEGERDQLLDLGANYPMLRYIRFDAIMDPGHCELTPAQNQAAFMPGDFCKISANHPDWFLLDQNGQRIVRPSGSQSKLYYYMDPGNQGWRDFFLSRLREVHSSDPRWDGVFLDNVETSLDFRRGRGQLPLAYPNDASYTNAIQECLKYLRDSFFTPARQVVFANLVARKNEADFSKNVQHLDGAMHESWVTSYYDGYRAPMEWEVHLEIAEQTQALGKTIILVAQGGAEDEGKQTFAYASYLLIDNGLAVFRYANSDQYNEKWSYENYSFVIGTPLGPRYKDGNIWRRDFTNARVMVDPYNYTATIEVKK